MVAYSFQAQFRVPILIGTKRQTIRSNRKRHARPGEIVQLYTGMRTRDCKLIGLAICSRVGPVGIGVERGWMEVGGVRVTDPDLLDLLAVKDGFQNWAAMTTFWRRKHPMVAVFSGVVIQWEGLTT